MKPKSVKRIFLFFIFYLPFQYILVGIIGVIYSEPWPAFVLPGFKSVMATHERVEVVEARFFAIPAESTKQPSEISPGELFEGLPESQLQGFLRTNFNDQASFTADTGQWLKQRVEQILPKKIFSALEVRWVAIQYSQSDKSKEINREIRLTFTIKFEEE